MTNAVSNHALNLIFSWPHFGKPETGFQVPDPSWWWHRIITFFCFAENFTITFLKTRAAAFSIIPLPSYQKFWNLRKIFSHFKNLYLVLYVDFDILIYISSGSKFHFWVWVKKSQKWMHYITYYPTSILKCQWNCTILYQ